MKIEYIKKIHVGEERLSSNEPKQRITFTLTSKDEGIIQMCCENAKRGFFEVAYDGHSLVDRGFTEKQKPLETPLICIQSYEPDGCDGGEELMLPIEYCPFCGKKNEIIHLKTVQVNHKFKIVKKEVDQKEWYKEETEIL